MKHLRAVISVCIAAMLIGAVNLFGWALAKLLSEWHPAIVFSILSLPAVSLVVYKVIEVGVKEK